MRVENVVGSSHVAAEPPKPYVTWLEYWENYVEVRMDPNRRYICPACEKAFYRHEFDGCHVQKAQSHDRNWYIVPLCSSCNHRTDILDIGDVTLAPTPSNL